MDKKLENELKKRLEKETEEVTELKEKTWNNISRELFPEKIKKTRKNWIKPFFATLGTVAVAAILFFVFVTGNFTDETQDDPVQNDSTQGANEPDTEEDKGIADDSESDNDNDLEDNQENDQEDLEQDTSLKDRFPHEKQVEIELEGMKEPVTVQLATNEELGYIIYFEKDGYQFISGEDMDEIVFVGESDDRLPKELGMEIRKVNDITAEEAIKNVKDSLANDGMSFLREETVDWPIEAVMIEGIEGDLDDTEWNTSKHRYYVTEREGDSLYVIKQKFFSVGSEGIGMRFDWMLNSFETVK